MTKNNYYLVKENQFLETECGDFQGDTESLVRI